MPSKSTMYERRAAHPVAVLHVDLVAVGAVEEVVLLLGVSSCHGTSVGISYRSAIAWITDS